MQCIYTHSFSLQNNIVLHIKIMELLVTPCYNVADCTLLAVRGAAQQRGRLPLLAASNFTTDKAIGQMG